MDFSRNDGGMLSALGVLAGHTKFAPDRHRLFTKNVSAYKTADVFTIHELQTLCTPSASTVVEDGDNVLTW